LQRGISALLAVVGVEDGAVLARLRPEAIRPPPRFPSDLSDQQWEIFRPLPSSAEKSLLVLPACLIHGRPAVPPAPILDQTAAAPLWPTLTIWTVAAAEPTIATAATAMTSQRGARLLPDPSPVSPTWERPCRSLPTSTQCNAATATPL
jgi:hypothetical protein